ncbi:MAG: DUF4214 domain-containing protein [Sphingobium sp.]
MVFEDNESVSQMLALPVAAFVQAAYSKLLGRAPDMHELKANIGALRCGLGRVHFLDNIYESDEFRARIKRVLNEGSDGVFITREFVTYLGRKPDPQGLEHYLGLLESGKGREDVHRDITRSKESKKSYTFWFELDRILNDWRKGIHPIKRWIGKHVREERQINRNFEIAIMMAYLSRKSDTASSYVPIEHNVSSDTHLNFDENVTPIEAPLSPVLMHEKLNGAAQKIRLRLQHADRLSSASRNNY